MKTRSIIALVVLVCSGPPLAAQLQSGKDLLLLRPDRLLLKKEDLLLRPSLLDPHSLLLTPRGLQPPAGLPASPALSVRERIEELRKHCPLAQAARPSVVLEGERQTNERVGLKWETKNGGDYRSFYVERSLGDTLHFYTANLVWARSLQKFKEKYRLPDDNAFDGISYYRLRLTDADNRVFYSNTAAVKGYQIEGFTVYPNPAAQTAWLYLNTPQQGRADISLYDARGRQVRQLPATLNGGGTVKTLDLHTLPAGVYLVTIKLPDKTTRTARVVKE